MRTVATSDTTQDLEEIIEAARREPVVIQRQERDVAVVMSMDEYERLASLNVAEFQRFIERVGAKARETGMTEEVLQGLLGSEG